MGGGPWEPKGIPWEGTPLEGNPWEPKGSHGRGPGPPTAGNPFGAKGIPWEGTLGPLPLGAQHFFGAEILANSSGRARFSLILLRGWDFS